jgi:hypothetical protein
MADFSLWATACETAMWADGAFWAAYSRNLEEATDSVIDADSVAGAIRILIIEQPEWAGSAADLLAIITQTAGDRIAKAKDWPGTPKALTGRLRRASPLLRKLGIEISFPVRTHHGQPRTIAISCRPADQAKRSAQSAPSAQHDQKPIDNKPLAGGPIFPESGPIQGPEKDRPNIGPTIGQEWADEILTPSGGAKSWGRI